VPPLEDDCVRAQPSSLGIKAQQAAVDDALRDRVGHILLPFATAAPQALPDFGGIDVEVAVVVATVVFCIEYRDEENILLIICSLVLIGITYYVQSRVIYLLDYVEVSNNQFTQCSFSGKRKRAVNSDEPIYYQIVPLIEGVYSRADFIVLSNQEFLPYRNGSGLGTVCKEASAKGNQIIMPYNQKSRPLLHLGDWHKVCFY
jgi:hypothetical protein